MTENNYNGRVQWFNKRRGYGFIKVLSDDEYNDKDLFCHYSNINTTNYKTLFPGEYVSFNILKNDDGREICINITGCFGGPLLIDNETNTYRIIPKKNLDNEHFNNRHSDNEDSNNVN